MGVVVRVESTPNPRARKWVLRERVCEGSRSFLRAEDAAGDPLGSALMAIEGVRCVLLCSDWVTVNVEDEKRWRGVAKRVESTLEAGLGRG